MKKYWLFILVATFLLNACASSALPPATETVIPTATATFSPTSTPTLSTPTITPLPTIPTFTPTFDTSTIVTVTPVPKAECPKENPELIPDFPYCDNGGCSGGPYNEVNLNYLNAGGMLDKLEKQHWGLIVDLTGDGLKELIFTEWGSSFIYGCQEGKYKVLLEFKGTQRTPHVDNIVELNGNTTPEVIIINAERHAFRSIHVFEWNGKEFVSLIERSTRDYVYDWVGGVAFEYKVANINKDELKEIIGVDNELFTYEGLPGLPLRRVTTTLAWNGKNYVVVSNEPFPPSYRFQAIQDADYKVLHGQYEKALSLYQDVISNDKLEWWSKERREYEAYTSLNSYFDEDFRDHPISLTITPTPFPTMQVVLPDTTEYPRLAAYAYYRIMLLHLAQGQESNADTAYNTLQQTFGSDPYGRPYVEMATAFRDAYQSTQKMYDGCATAIQYAAEHPEILIPLGSDYHGAQSHTYKPEDVCPFR